MNQVMRRNWLYEGEARSLGNSGMDSAHAFSEAFDRSAGMWEEHTPEDPMVLVDLADAMRDLSAKALILLGVQEGCGASARLIEFAGQHHDEALAALREGRPLSPEIVAQAHREWKEYCRERHEKILALREPCDRDEEEQPSLSF